MGLQILYKEEYSILDRWINSTIVKEENPSLFSNLLKIEYIVPEQYDENKVREKICANLKNRQKILYNKYCRVHFLLTYACNFACPYCYEHKNNYSKILSKEQVDKIFAIHNNNIKNIGFFGGEPLLPCNKEIIEYIISKAPNATYNITTNGYYLDQYIDILKNINIVSLQITLDGNKELHDKTRILSNGKGTYDKVISGIKCALQHGLPTTIRMNISQDNVDACLKEKEHIEDMK